MASWAGRTARPEAEEVTDGGTVLTCAIECSGRPCPRFRPRQQRQSEAQARAMVVRGGDGRRRHRSGVVLRDPYKDDGPRSNDRADDGYITVSEAQAGPPSGAGPGAMHSRAGTRIKAIKLGRDPFNPVPPGAGLRPWHHPRHIPGLV